MAMEKMTGNLRTHIAILEVANYGRAQYFRAVDAQLMLATCFRVELKYRISST